MSRVVGLTGGIASGKSTVSAMLKQRGAQIVDADQIARSLVEIGQPALAEIAEAFGSGVLDERGGLNRGALRAVVFADANKRRALGAIMHQRIRAEAERQIALGRQITMRAGQEFVVVYDAALLVETGAHQELDLNGLIVTNLDEAEQIRRLCKRDGLTEKAARECIAAQMPLCDKLALATWVIDTSGAIEATRAQVEKLWLKLSTS